MSLIVELAEKYSKRARAEKKKIFRNAFDLDENTRILDLGSETGVNIHSVLEGAPVRAENVYIADIFPGPLEEGKRKYGYIPVLVKENEPLPFEDKFFDIVYCSSVIEHVTVSKTRAWSVRSGREFRMKSLKRQMEFADEIKRLGRQYFVQTPYRFFPLETHCWLPFFGWLPRRLLIPALRVTNTFWVKRSLPDWYLLNRREMAALFGDALIVEEKAFGITKSLMAVKTLPAPAEKHPIYPGYVVSSKKDIASDGKISLPAGSV